MVIYSKYGVRFCEVWFDELPAGDADIIIRRQQRNPIINAEVLVFSTLLVDLLNSEGDIFANIKKNTRYEIRRASNGDACQVQSFLSPSSQILDEFIGFYYRFAEQKKLSKPKVAYLKKLNDSNCLVLTRVFLNGEVLVWHAYYCASRRARLLYSASLFRGLQSSERNLIGRANRMLHWEDIKFFKESGFKLYDFGGWVSPKSIDDEKKKINSFKEEFGGEVHDDYDCVEVNTFKGAVYKRISLFFNIFKRVFSVF